MLFIRIATQLVIELSRFLFFDLVCKIVKEVMLMIVISYY